MFSFSYKKKIMFPQSIIYKNKNNFVFKLIDNL